MTPERWRQITELFHAAREHDPARREAFLAGACREDATLRREVEAMLAGHDQGEALDEVSLFASAFRLEPGVALGAYRIEQLIGTGGMGEVYRARDTKLGRDVAIKVLPPLFTTDPERLARFEREARLLASLNHPHVGAIYGIEDSGAVHGLVLELVEGPTLQDRLADGPLSLTEALSAARQIAEALEAAHEKGIVHRDLKPANVKITPAGVIKVIDFGLARAVRGDEAEPYRSKSPTVTVGGTRDGLIVGSAAYMSPEQARGRPVDKRADIWAFACVLYELLTGRAAFPGETMSDTIAAVLEREPDWRALPPHVPDTIRKLLKRCFRKDPSERLHDIADARLDIEEGLSAEPESTPSAGVAGWRKGWLWVTSTLAAVATAAAVWLFAANRSPTAPTTGLVEFPVRFPEDTVLAYGVAVSPNGRRVVASAAGNPVTQLWVYSLDSPDPHPLPGTVGGGEPFWSPDSSHIGFFAADRKLKRVDPNGGPPVSVADAKRLTGGSWNSDDVIIFSSGSDLFRVSASGGTPVRIAVSDQEGPQIRRTFPQFLPDNRHFIYYVQGPQSSAVYAGSLVFETSRHLLDVDSPAVFAPPGYLLFVRGTALMAQKFNPNSLHLEDTPFFVAPDVKPGALGSRPQFSASDGVLSFVKTRSGIPGQLTWFDRAGKTLRSIPQSLGEEYLNPAISPSGELVAANRMDPQTGNWDIWIVDARRGIPSRFTSDPGQDADPVWSPDGKEIVFASTRGGHTGLYRKAVDGSEPEDLLLEIGGDVASVVPTDWSHDGKFILYSRRGFSPGWSIWALPLFGPRTPIKVTSSAVNQYGARLSPDGRWVAYESSEAGIFAIYIQRFLAPGEMKQVSGIGGNHPRWTSDGRELVYWVLGKGLESVNLEFTESGLRASVPKTLIATPVLGLIDGRTHYDMTRDGQRFLLRQPAGRPVPPTIMVMLNWTEKLKR